MGGVDKSVAGLLGLFLALNVAIWSFVAWVIYSVLRHYGIV